MNSAPRLIARSLLTLAALVACGVAPAGHSASPAADLPAAGEEIAAMRPEGRLRKLHLVRPDLIPYPIAYEVYC